VAWLRCLLNVQETALATAARQARAVMYELKCIVKARDVGVYADEALLSI
jgi:hypothetical protein